MNQDDIVESSSTIDIRSKQVNDACWAFIDAMPHTLPGPIWNDLKPAVHAAICNYLAGSKSE